MLRLLLRLEISPGVSKQDAQVALKGTTSGDKNELLFSRFATNYNEIPQRFRKGTTLFRARPTAVVPPPPVPSQQPSQGGRAATGIGESGDGAPPKGGDDEENSTGQQARKTAGQTSSLTAVDSKKGGCSPVDGNPEAVSPRGAAQAGAVQVHPAAGKEQVDNASEMSGRGKTAEEAKTACRDTAVVKVVPSADGKGRSKRLLKKGHAPPGAIEEDACDLIRDDFWGRNPQILAGVARRR